jgi:hypothetical protein
MGRSINRVCRAVRSHCRLAELELKPVRAVPAPPVIKEIDRLTAIRVAVEVQEVR